MFGLYIKLQAIILQVGVVLVMARSITTFQIVDLHSG